MANGTIKKGSLVKNTGGSGGGGSAVTINYFDGVTGTTLNTQLTLGNSVMVFKNGVLLEPTNDYTISSSTITFVTALEATDKIAVINGDLNGIDVTSFQKTSNISQDYTETSATKYPSSYALKEGLATKQATLTTQTAYTSKGTSTKVAQITTNTLGQVTGITEVDISFPTEIPSQTGNSGKALTTNGSNVSWGNFVPAPTVLTDETSTSMALAGNTIYKWTNALTSLSFASVEVSDLETVLYFTTGGTITFTDSSSLKWGGDGSAPSGLEINTIYCISIRNGLAEIDTFGTVS